MTLSGLTHALAHYLRSQWHLTTTLLFPDRNLPCILRAGE